MKKQEQLKKLKERRLELIEKMRNCQDRSKHREIKEKIDRIEEKMISS